MLICSQCGKEINNGPPAEIVCVDCYLKSFTDTTQIVLDVGKAWQKLLHFAIDARLKKINKQEDTP